MTFEIRFEEARPSFEAAIAREWLNQGDQEIVRPAILLALEHLLRSEWSAAQEAGTADAFLDPVSLEHRGLDLLKQTQSSAAFAALWCKLQPGFLYGIQRRCRGRRNSAEESQGLLNSLYIKLRPKSDGTWGFDSTRGIKFSTYAWWAVGNLCKGRFRKEARQHPYRLENAHLCLLRDAGVPEDWLERLKSLVGKWFPTGGCFEGAIMRLLNLKSLDFDDFRIRTIFDCARLRPVSLDSGLSIPVEADTPDSFWAHELRDDTAACLDAISQIALGDELAAILKLYFFDGLSQSDIAKTLYPKKAKGNANPTIFVTRKYHKALEMIRDCLSRKGWGSPTGSA